MYGLEIIHIDKTIMTMLTLERTELRYFKKINEGISNT